MVNDATTEPDSQSRAWLFLRFGLAPAVVIGYVMIAVSDALSRAGVPLSSVSVLVIAAFLPATLMFLWAPLIDTVGARQRWILVGVLLLCAAAVGLAHDAAGLTGLLLTDATVIFVGLLPYVLCARFLHQGPLDGPRGGA